MVVTTVYELGEGAPEAALKAGSGGLATLVLGASLCDLTPSHCKLHCSAALLTASTMVRRAVMPPAAGHALSLSTDNHDQPHCPS